ncbi:MAG: group III truncated hemoglobin [Acidihalobacter sp.]
MTAEIIGMGNIRRVVDEFYERVREDPVLGPRFEGVADWSEHKARIAHFWWLALGGAAYESFRYRVVQTHRIIDVQGVEIEHWLRIFADCVRSSLSGPLAEAWLHRARAMGRSLSSVAGRG